MRAPGAARLFRPRTARALASPLPGRIFVPPLPCAPPRPSQLYASPPLQKPLSFTNHDRLSLCLCSTVLTRSPRGQQRLPALSLLSLALWQVDSRSTHSPYPSQLLPPSLSPPRFKPSSSPCACARPARVTRFLFAVSGNRAAATATGRATGTQPSTKPEPTSQQRPPPPPHRVRPVGHVADWRASGSRD